MARDTIEVNLFKPLLEVGVRGPIQSKQKAIEAFEAFCRKVYLLSNAGDAGDAENVSAKLLAIVADELENKLNWHHMLRLENWLDDVRFQIFIACSGHSLLGENIKKFVSSIYREYAPEQYPRFETIQHAVGECYAYLVKVNPNFEQSMQGTGFPYTSNDIKGYFDSPDNPFDKVDNPIRCFNKENFSVCCSTMLDFSARCFYDIKLRVAETIYDLTYSSHIFFREGDSGVVTALEKYFFKENKPFMKEILSDDSLLEKYFEILLITLYKLSNLQSSHSNILNQLYLSLATLAHGENSNDFPTFSNIAKKLTTRFQGHFRGMPDQQISKHYDKDRFAFNQKLKGKMRELDQGMMEAYAAYRAKLDEAPQAPSIAYRDYNEKRMMSVDLARQQQRYDTYALQAWEEYCQEEDALLAEYSPEFCPFLYRYMYALKIEMVETNYQNSVVAISNRPISDTECTKMTCQVKACKDQQIEEFKRRFHYDRFHTIDEFPTENSLPLPLPVALSQENAIPDTQLLFMLQGPNQFEAAISSIPPKKSYPVLPPKVTHWSTVVGYVGFGLLGCVGLAAIGAATAATFGLIHLAWFIPSVYFALGAAMTLTAGVGVLLMSNKRRAKVDSIFEKMSNKISALFLRHEAAPVIHLPKNPTPRSSPRSQSPNHTALPAGEGEILPAPSIDAHNSPLSSNDPDAHRDTSVQPEPRDYSHGRRPTVKITTL